ncbi:MAG: ComEC/Rec2 family competence protein [Syntrophales bacterium]|nr:ComEC/Rec2 family competence protein [Syntrophales bacterium]MDD5643692.1 ComEC/Rec2 family competence protein [Syntrophales bacterium]
MARPLVWVTLAFMGGLAAPSWGLRIPGGWLLLGLSVLGALLVLAWWTKRQAGGPALAFFCLLGVAFYQQAQQPFFPPPHLTNLPLEEELTLEARLVRPGKIGAQGVQMLVEATAWRSPSGWRPVSGKLLLTAPSFKPPPVGAALVLKTRLRAPRVLKNPGSFDRARYLAADGIFRVGSLRRPEDLIVLANAGASPLRERLRGSIRRLLEKLPQAPRAMYLAMLLGDQGEITPEMRQAFSRTGTSHLLVINGMHLGAVAAVAYFLCFLMLRRFPRLLLRINALKVSTLVAAVPVVAYAWMAGGSPATQRAEIMVLAYLLLLFLGRPREVWSALALAALIILCLSPLRFYTISFQLSFITVAALIYFLNRWFRRDWEDLSAARWLWKWRKKAWLWGKEAAAASLVATLASAPLVAAYFQVVSLLGAAVNLAAIPLVLFLALPLGEVAVLAQSLHLTPAAQGLLALGQIPLWLGYETIAAAARLPGSAFTCPTPTWWQIAAYFLLWVMLFPLRRRWWTWMGAALAGVALAGTVSLPLLQGPKDLEVTCLDTGGVLAGVAVSPEGQRLVFSAPGASWPGQGGGSPGPLPAYLHGRQWQRLDEVVALRLAQGNAPALLALARQFRVGQFWYGRLGSQGPAYYELMNLLGDQRRSPRSLEWGNPPGVLGSVALAWRPLGARGVALQLTYQGRVVLILPPGTRIPAGKWAFPPGTRPAALFLPGKPAPDLETLAASLHPEIIIIYGAAPEDMASGALPPGSRCLRTADGAVSLRVSAGGASVRQWHP